MKHLTFILLLLFVGCTNQTEIKDENQKVKQKETPNEIGKSVSDLWKSYVDANPESQVEDLPKSGRFHNNREDANRLAELILKGQKKASSGLYRLYEQQNVALPKVGTKLIVTDFDGYAKAIIEYVSVDTVPFNEISGEYAKMDMGTDIDPLEKWEKAHWDFFENILKSSGDQLTEEMLVVCIKFENIWPKI